MEPRVADGGMPVLEMIGGVGIVTPTGDLDHREMARVKDSVTYLLRLGVHRVVLDLSLVDHVNYMSLGMLVERAGRLRGESGDLRLAGVSGYLLQILRFAGVHHLFEMFPTAEEAADSFGWADPVFDYVSAGSRARWVPRLQ